MKISSENVDLHSVYIKELSLSAAEERNFDFDKWRPDLAIEFGSNYRKINEKENFFEVSITFKIVAKCGKKVAFELKLCQAGLFALNDNPADVDVDFIMRVDCPNTLFPFQRRAVAEAVSTAGFPQFLLGMVDVRKFYQQRIAALKGAQSPHMCH